MEFVEAAHLIKVGGDQYEDCNSNFQANINALGTMANLFSGAQSATIVVGGYEHSSPTVTGLFSLAKWL